MQQNLNSIKKGAFTGIYLKRNTLRERIRKKELIFGLGIRSGSTDFVEIAGLTGYDFVYIDRMHDLNSWDTIKKLVIAADVVDIACIVRVEENHAPLIWRALDLGVQGVLVPDVFTRDEMIKVVQAAKYPPEGKRGADGEQRGGRFHIEDWASYMKRKNDETNVWIMIEHKEAVDNLDNILTVQGLDCVTFGPTDYTVSVGLPGQRDHPLIKQAQETILSKANQQGVAVQMVFPRDALGLPDVEAGVELVKKGANIFLMGEDQDMFRRSCIGIIEKVKKLQ